MKFEVILWTPSEKVDTDRSWMNCQWLQRRVRQAAAATREKGGESRDTETGQGLFRLNGSTVTTVPYYGICERHGTVPNPGLVQIRVRIWIGIQIFGSSQPSNYKLLHF